MLEERAIGSARRGLGNHEATLIIVEDDFADKTADRNFYVNWGGLLLLGLAGTCENALEIQWLE